jgi:F420H(2)-dependent quinone reductase
MNWQKRYNPLVIWLLRSPLHSLVDQHTMVITVTGRRSGKHYTLPVSYVRDGETLLVISQKDRTWWKNLRNGAPVTVLLQGHALQQVPTYQRLLHVPLNSTGQPENPEALKRLAQDHVIVRVRELTALAA